MHIKNKIFAATILGAFSWFSPLFTILSQLLLGLLGPLLKTVISSWWVSNFFDMAILLVAHIIFMWVLVKKFSKNDILHGVLIFALLNVVAGMMVFRNPVSTQGLFYQTVNFLSNVILSNVVFVPEQGKPYMLLLPFITLAIHVLLAKVIPFIQTSDNEKSNSSAENV